MPVNHESPVREGLIIKRSAEMSAAAIGYAQKVACELVCQTQGLEKLSAEDVELIENSQLVPVVLAGLAKLGSYEKGVEKHKERAAKHIDKIRAGAKRHMGVRALRGFGIGGALGAGLGALTAPEGGRGLSAALHGVGGGVQGSLIDMLSGQRARQMVGTYEAGRDAEAKREKDKD
jgi:hypothetical protein